MQAALKGNKVASKVTSAAAPVSTGKYGIGATAAVAASRRAPWLRRRRVLGKVGGEVSSLYRGVFGAAGRAPGSPSARTSPFTAPPRRCSR